MAGPSNVRWVGFGLNGDTENMRNSCVEITSAELYTQLGEPVKGGAYDLRLGTTDHGFKCLTCEQDKKRCPGHPGHMVSRVALPQPVAIGEIRSWLRAVCLVCGEIVAERAKYTGIATSKRLAAAAADTAGKICRACNAVHPKITKDPNDNFTFWTEPPGTAATSTRSLEQRGTKLYYDTVRAIFERVSNSSAELLGRPHPSTLVLNTIAVPPSTIRPGVRNFGGGSNSHHDATNLFQHLLNRNASLPTRLPEGMGRIGGGQVDGALDRSVQNYTQIYFDALLGGGSGGARGGGARGGGRGRRSICVGSRPVNGFMSGQSSKHGRIRGTLLGKRTFMISRTTISGNVQLSVNQVGIPVNFARILQVEETVQEHNRDRLTVHFLNGRQRYPGSTYVVRRATREYHDVAGLRNSRLEIGDVLSRDIVDGDPVYFNRQPTLERSSIGVHEAVVVLDPNVRTFQMNVLACSFYNGDFDGDQMTVWPASTPATRIEARIVSGVANWFISTKSSGPVVGQLQDSVVGCYTLTLGTAVADKFRAMAVFAGVSDPPRFDVAGDVAENVFSGRKLVSLLLSRTPVDHKSQPTSGSDMYVAHAPIDPGDLQTVVTRGNLVHGVLDKRATGSGAGGLAHLVSREYGSARALKFVYELQGLALRYLRFCGFTIGVCDLWLPAEARAHIRELVGRVHVAAGLVTDSLLRGELIPPIGSTTREFYERTLTSGTLRVAEAEALRWILGSINTKTNGFYRMISTGAKGVNPNLTSVMANIGQTTINGSRIGEHFGFRRQSPFYPRCATDPAAGGFVSNSYMSGMNLPEFLAQAANGRFDLISKALSTADTGYFARKGVMVLQTAIVDNHRRLMKDTAVLQILYGEDGIDTRELEMVEFRTLFMKDAAVRAYAMPETKTASPAVEGAVARIIADRDAMRRHLMRIQAAGFPLSGGGSRHMPVNVRRIVEGVFAEAALAGEAAKVASSAAAAVDARIARVEELCARLPFAFLNDIQERRGLPPPPEYVAATSFLAALVRAELCPRVLALLTDEQLEYIMDAIRHRLRISLIDYGTAAGIIAAQALSEPMTQYMLDSHHRSVSGGTNKSGLMRVAEIYGARAVENEQSPHMTLPLREGWSDAAAVANAIEQIQFRQFVKRYDVIVEPFGKLVYPEFAGDASWIAEFARAHPLVRPPSDLTNWCLRFVLDKGALALKAAELELIVRRLRTAPDVHVVHTAEAVPEIVIRIWLRTLSGSGDEAVRVRARLNGVFDTLIRGVTGFTRAAVEQITQLRSGSEGTFAAEKTPAIVTDGTNFYHALMCPAIDAARVSTTSVGETLLMLGIEAARAKIVSETMVFMEGNSPNPRHLFVYADEMTRTGVITSVERAGLARCEPNNTFLRMAYGAPTQVIADAALAQSHTRVYGIAAPLMLGAIPQVGTRFNKFHINEEFVKKNLQEEDDDL